MQIRRGHPSVFPLLLIVLLSAAVVARPARANSCSLADHIRSANTNTSIGGCPQGTNHDIITLSEDITLSEALPPIRGTITIEGNGHAISGDNQFRIFEVSGGALTIRNLTLRNGRARDSKGGAIAMTSDSSRLNVERSNFIGNVADDHGGAIYIRGNATITGSSFLDNRSRTGYGGALYADPGVIQITNSTFHNNQATGGGALAIWRAEVTATHVTMVDNRSTIRSGDAIDKLDGIVKLRNSILVNPGETKDCAGELDQNIGNLGRDGSCGITRVDDARLGDMTGSPAYIPLRDHSPAIDAAHPNFCTATDQRGVARPHGRGCDIGALESTAARPPALPIVPPPACPLAEQIIAANTDAPAGGCPAGNGHDIITLTRDIALSRKLPAITSDITIEGNGFAISGNTRFPIFAVNAGTLTIKNVTLADANNLQGAGGALFVRNNGAAVVRNSEFVNNIALWGGAIAVDRGAGLSVNGSRFISNRAGRGGAIDVSTGFRRVAVSVANSSFINNSAIGSGGISGTGKGGAVFAELSQAVEISNSTFMNNRATFGRAVASRASTITLTHVTVLDQSAKGSVLGSEANGAINMRNSIIAANTPTNSALCFGGLLQNISNLIEDGSCAPALRGDPMLEDATESAQWRAPLPGSPAIDAADARFCPETDQIGRARPQDGGCDIGANESYTGSPALPDPDTAEQMTNGCSVTTTHALNFRDGPGGARIGLVAEGATLGATARTAGWFQVEYRGAFGWISADYVTAAGVCG